MSKNYEDYRPLNPGPIRRRRSPFLSFLQFFIIFILIIAVVFSCGYFVITHINEGGTDDPIQTNPPVDTGTKPPEQSGPAETGGETTPPATTAPQNPPSTPGIDTSKYKGVEFKKSQIHKGDLILVNSKYKAVYPADTDLISMVLQKTSSYKVYGSNILFKASLMPTINKFMDDFAAVSGKTNALVWTGYRDEATQETIYNNYVKNYGEERAKTEVAKPNESDHHTGLGLVFKVLTASGGATALRKTEGYSWIVDNAYKYGFVERYPDDKISVTGLDYTDTFYLRYVGVPHAQIMKEKKMCLEEYIEFLKNYEFGKKHYNFKDENGVSYEIYYVEVNSDYVNVPLPKTDKYTISGNNADGFIVTVTLS